MTPEEIMEKNTTLSFEFSLYVLEHPEFARRIPRGARVVLLPKDDPEFREVNVEIASSTSAKDDRLDRPVVYVEFERLRLVRSRLVRPRLVSLSHANPQEAQVP